jgi:hypothetical protein
MLSGVMAMAVAPRPSFAHPVSVSRALVYISATEITAEIELFLEDLYLFHALRTDNRDYLSTVEIERGIDLHGRFVTERFQILDVDGRPLVPKRVAHSAWKPPNSGVPLAELMDHHLTFSLRFDLDDPPEFLTFVQKFTDERAVLPSEMTLHVQQEQQPETKPIALRPHQPYILRLRWGAPPIDAGDGQDRREAWLAKAKQETLGITNYSSTYSFLYVENRQVRHEILIPLQTLLLDLPIEHENADFLSPQEQQTAKSKVADYFASGIPIWVNGIPIDAKLERCDFFGLITKDFAGNVDDRDVSLSSGRVGVILSYVCQAIPQSVSMSWNRFTESMWAVNVVIVSGDHIEKRTLSRVGNRHKLEWNNQLPPSVTAFSPNFAEQSPRIVSRSWAAALGAGIVVLAWMVSWRVLQSQVARWRISGMLAVVAVLVGFVYRLGQLEPISTADGTRIFTPLHRNVYRAFEYSTDEQIYDALSLSVDGELLDRVYRQIYRSLHMKGQGGAIAHVTSVDIKAGTVRQSGHADVEPSFEYLCQWDVAGNIEHWGHLHERRQRYKASFQLKVVDGYWKITHWDMLEEQLLGTTVSVRELGK